MICIQKQKKGVAQCKMHNVKKVAKAKVAAKKWLWLWFDSKNLIKTIQANFVLIPSKAGMRPHRFTWIVITEFLPLNYHHSHFLATILDFTTFSQGTFSIEPHFFFTARLFLVYLFQLPMNCILHPLLTFECCKTAGILPLPAVFHFSTLWVDLHIFCVLVQSFPCIQ